MKTEITQVLCIKAICNKKEKERKEWQEGIGTDEIKPWLCSCLHFHTGPSHDRKQKRGDVFLPAWDFDTCLTAPNWNGSLSNEISARRTGSGKKVTHYNYSTWLTELSHLCSPTFTLISFRGPGEGIGAGACFCVRACLCTRQFDMNPRASFSHIGSLSMQQN